MVSNQIISQLVGMDSVMRVNASTSHHQGTIDSQVCIVILKVGYDDAAQVHKHGARFLDDLSSQLRILITGVVLRICTVRHLADGCQRRKDERGVVRFRRIRNILHRRHKNLGRGFAPPHIVDPDKDDGDIGLKKGRPRLPDIIAAALPKQVTVTRGGADELGDISPARVHGEGVAVEVDIASAPSKLPVETGIGGQAIVDGGAV